MKSLIVSALAVGIASAQSQYYIGNYSAQGKFASVVPYPLGVCLETGYPAPYAIFTCNGTYVTEELFSSSDSTCSGTATKTSFKPDTTPASANYAHCSGPVSYMIIDQFLSSCSNWKKGYDSITGTTVAVDACTLYNVTNSVPFYSKSICDGDSHTMILYAGDNTCTNSSVMYPTKTLGLGCSYFGNRGSFKIYSAMRQCVINGIPQRCSKNLVEYSAKIRLTNVTNFTNYQTMYQNIFPYSTSIVSMVNMTDTPWPVTELTLNLSFCTQWEDGQYSSGLKNLGKTTLDSGYVMADSVCWTCTGYSCANSTLCGLDSYCVLSEQCATTATTTTPTATTTTAGPTKSANVIYVSFFTLIALVLSFALF